MGNANYSIIWTIWSLLFQYSILAQRIRSDNAGTKNNTKYLSVISGFDKFASSIHGSQSSQQRSVFNAFAVFQCPNNFFLRRPIVGRPTADHRPTADCRKQKRDIIWDLGLAELPIIIGSLDSLQVTLFLFKTLKFTDIFFTSKIIKNCLKALNKASIQRATCSWYSNN